MSDMSNDSPKLRIAVCGGGIAGMAFVSLLDHHKFAIDVFEAGPDIRTTGFGLAMWQRYWDQLDRRLDFGAECASRGVLRPEWSEIRGPSLRKSDTPTNGDEFFTLDQAPFIIPRTVLLEILLEKANEKSCNIHTNKRLISYSSNVDGTITLKFKDGSQFETDLLVGADGVHSQVRASMFQDEPVYAAPQFSGQMAYRMKCRADDLRKIHPNHLALFGFHIWCGKGRSMTSNHVGEFVQMTAYDNVPYEANTVYPQPWVSDTPLKEVLQLFEGWEPELVSLVEAAGEASRWAIHEVTPLLTFISHNVVLVGDAAHAMTPHMGSGGGQSIEDALILSQLLNHPAAGRANIMDSLGIYNQVRKDFSQKVAQWSMECGLMYSFLLPGPDKLPLNVLGKEFLDRTAWLKERDALDNVIILAEAMFEECLQRP